MGNKPTVLFVLFEGLADTVIDSQVLSHIRVMQEHGIAEFEVMAFDNTDELYERSLERQARATALAQAPVWIHHSARPGSPFSVELNSHKLNHVVELFGKKFTHIHARTEYSVLAAHNLAQRMNAKLIWDCRGDAAAEVSYRYTGGTVFSKMSHALRARILNRRSKMAAEYCDRAIFVSSPLYQHMQPWLGDKPYEILPSSASGELFFYDAAVREQARADLGIAPNRKVYVYSGSIKAYQRFDDTVDIFSQIHKNDPDALFLVLTPNIEQARAKLSDLPEDAFILRQAYIYEMNALLNASDAAFMLRDSTPTNWVAAPTKFSEYCLTGLPVVMTDAVINSHSMAAKFGNLIDAEDINNPNPIPAIRREDVASNYKPILSRHGQVDAYRRVYGSDTE